MSIKLKIKEKLTIAGEALLAAASPEGVAVDPMSFRYGSRNYPAIKALLGAGLIEAKAVGPRGGQRYFITKTGAEALVEAKIAGGDV